MGLDGMGWGRVGKGTFGSNYECFPISGCKDKTSRELQHRNTTF